MKVKKPVLYLAFGLIAGYVGVSAISASRAATYAVSNEAETGVKSGSYNDGDGNGASGNAAVRFGNNSNNTANSRFGMSVGGDFQYLSAAEQNSRLDTIKNLGAQWVRVDLKWTEIQNGGPTSFDWSRHDATVATATSRGLKVLLIPLGAPTWARQPSCASLGDTCTPADASSFATFTTQAAKHYASLGVHTWEIWNEPNNTVFWKPKPNAVQYTQFLKAGYTAIKSQDPTATILAGSTAPEADDGANIDPRTFMQTIYAQGGKNYFDAYAHHPYCYAGAFDCPNTVAAWSAWSQMNDTSLSLRSIMAANGDSDKKIWLTEFGAPTGGNDGSAVTEAKQAQMATDAYNDARSLPWVGPIFWYSLVDRGTSTDREDWFGLIRADSSHKPAYDTYKSLATQP